MIALLCPVVSQYSVYVVLCICIMQSIAEFHIDGSICYDASVNYDNATEQSKSH